MGPIVSITTCCASTQVHISQGLNNLVGIDMSWAKKPEMMVALARAFISEVLAQIFVRRVDCAIVSPTGSCLRCVASHSLVSSFMIVFLSS